MSTHDLFIKHFGETAAVDLKHPNMESFFKELIAECLEEDKHKNCNIPVCSHEFIAREYASQPYGTCLACGKQFKQTD
ncbi:MAG TPA: hypothetical protein PKV22_00075 [Paludibacteraceae bacterium]|nr:hypothetical protein [Paludibacteraceae bacterium]HQH66325.1 hypothetical protein [Clostridia bacterium]